VVTLDFTFDHGCDHVLHGAMADIYSDYSNVFGPHLQFNAYFTAPGTYYLVVQVTRPGVLLPDDDAFFAVELVPATTSFDSVSQATVTWEYPYISGGYCYQGNRAPYSVYTWSPPADGYYDVTVLNYNTTHDPTITLAVFVSNSSTPPVGFGAQDFNACQANTNTTVRLRLTDTFNVISGVSYGYLSCITPMFYAKTSDVFYIAYSCPLTTFLRFVLL